MTIAVRNLIGCPVSVRMREFKDSQRFARERYLRSITRKSPMRSNRREALMFLLNRWFNNRTFPGYIYPGAEALAKAVRVSERTARTMLSEFRESRFIKIEALGDGGAGATRYTVDEEVIMHSLAPSRVKILPGELAQIEAYSDNFSVENQEFYYDGLPVLESPDSDRNDTAELPEFNGETTTSPDANTDAVPPGTPLQNLQTVLKVRSKLLSGLQGFDPQSRSSKSNHAQHSLESLFGLQVVMPLDLGRASPEPYPFQSYEGHEPVKNAYAMAKEGW